ncbi:MAG: MBL fold metallo-hydrolase [Bacteroidales bacterium]|nr:MBL fold metallo-hydrolase [Bacteroidales bacterium]
MIRFISLSSGSNGNCYYIGNEQVSLLIDVGVSGRMIKKRLSEFGISVDSISFVLVTHDHIDHIKHLGAFTQKFKTPVIATKKLHDYLSVHPCTRGCMDDCRKFVEKGDCYEYSGVRVTPFDVPHDANETLGYHIDFRGEKFTIITDAGRMTQEMIEYSRKASHLILESNYDYQMLMDGNYPRVLIERIKNGYGHLCNIQTAEALKNIYNSDLKNLFLCHLSENNNTPELAYGSACSSLMQIGVNEGIDINIKCLPRRGTYCHKFEE